MDTVQIFGEKKPKLAAVVQLRDGKVADENVRRSVSAALTDLDRELPDYVRFNAYQSASRSAGSYSPGPPGRSGMRSTATSEFIDRRAQLMLVLTIARRA